MILKLIKYLMWPLTWWARPEVVIDWLNNSYPYLEWLKRDLADCESILELGCGSNSPILKIGYGYKTDAVDIWQPYIDMHNKNGDYHSCKQADILSMEFDGKKYDAVVIFDVMEHLDREKALSKYLFEWMEHAARKKVIIFTPNGFVENDEVDGDPWQAHVSAWYPRDYQERGYKVVGSTGIRWLMGKASLPRFRPHKLFQLLILLTQPYVYEYPGIAWHSYAVKEIENTAHS